ncbi:MAG: oligoribonuclease, partial [Lysobacterales bacterium CG_4_9_14_3_um_filter_62_6]
QAFTKRGAHTALSDIRESLAELVYYRQQMGPLSGLVDRSA